MDDEIPAGPSALTSPSTRCTPIAQLNGNRSALTFPLRPWPPPRTAPGGPSTDPLQAPRPKSSRRGQGRQVGTPFRRSPRRPRPGRSRGRRTGPGRHSPAATATTACAAAGGPAVEVLVGAPVLHQDRTLLGLEHAVEE